MKDLGFVFRVAQKVGLKFTASAVSKSQRKKSQLRKRKCNLKPSNQKLGSHTDC